MQVGKLNPKGKINFPGFQEILDFTATGSESSVSVTVDGDVDKEYIVCCLSGSPTLIRLNNDSSSSNYGYQRVRNNAGSISASRDASLGALFAPIATGLNTLRILTPTGFIKTGLQERMEGVSGTSISGHSLYGSSWNSTVKVTSINYLVDGAGNFTAGTRIVVYARRAQ